jgi:hypothetical protein
MTFVVKSQENVRFNLLTSIFFSENNMPNVTKLGRDGLLGEEIYIYIYK